MSAITICPSLQLTGSCTDAGCQYSHDIFTCDVCKITFDKQKHLNSHINSMMHKKREARGGQKASIAFCSLCNTAVNPSSAWDMHAAGRRHRNRVRENGGVDVEPEELGARDGDRTCGVCGYAVPADRWASHIVQTAHRRRETYQSMQSVLDDASKDRNGINISHNEGLDFGIVEVVNASRGVRVELVTRLTDPMARIKLLDVKVVATATSAKR
jgi:helicase MOV-10